MSEVMDKLTIKEIPAGDIRPEVTDMLSKGARLIYASGVDNGVEGIRVDYYFGLDHIEKSRHVILRTHLDRENPVIQSVTPITRQADWSERELIEFLGIKAEGHPDPRHLWLPVNWDQMYTSSVQEGSPQTESITPGPVKAKQKENIVALPVTSIPYGPYHPAFIESNFFKMAVEDEVVKKAELKLGFNHRSIIKLMERRDYYKDIFLAERICGLCNAHHAVTFCGTVESIAGVTVPLRPRLIRTLLCELERIQSHLLSIGLVCDLMGFKTMFMHSLRVREDIQDSLELISGQRVTHGLITIGGNRRDITEKQADFVLHMMKRLDESAKDLFDQILSNDVLLKRLKGVGVLKQEDAVSMGAVGPTARGSGMRIDVRKDTPYAGYSDVDWDIITENGCDCLSRVKVKMRETMMSKHIVDQCCDRLKKEPGPLMVTVDELPCKEAIAKAEAPRGEVLYHVASNGTNTPDYVRIRTPSFRDTYIMLQLVQGVYVGDVPAIIGSIDPCFSCTDRVTVIKNDKPEVKRLHELGGMPDVRRVA